MQHGLRWGAGRVFALLWDFSTEKLPVCRECTARWCWRISASQKQIQRQSQQGGVLLIRVAAGHEDQQQDDD